ncbi:GIY-YIG nuclease family protein [Candidatus Bathyarchaeota archaeon]|jgi:hypothetical protein|nr:GIY-YIG nuclease family protein [Candidatus Bathyarchaeota archaeon]
MSCIYLIRNIVNEKFYVGQTTKTLRARLGRHFTESRYGKSKSYIHKAMRKYGRDAFTIELLEECYIDQLNNREIFWIKKLGAMEHGYNLTSGGSGVSGRKASIASSGENCPFYGKPSPWRRPVRQLNFNGDFLQEFPSMLAAREAMGASSGSGIRNCCKGRAKSAFGFVWRYADDDSVFMSPWRHPVRQLELDGTIIREFTSIKGAADAANVHYGSIRKAVKGIYKTAGGFCWELVV